MLDTVGLLSIFGDNTDTRLKQNRFIHLKKNPFDIPVFFVFHFLPKERLGGYQVR